MSERIALVTGASRGIGYHAALALAKAGCHVIALARTQGGLEELDDAIRDAGGSATLVPLDLRDFDGIERLNPALHERFGRLDVLFGNAGILGTPTPLGHLKPDEWQAVLDVNLSANFRLIRALEPLLHQSKAPRALFATSCTPRNERAYLGAYSATKSGLEALVRTWAKENRTTGLKANLLDPGTVATRMRAQYAPGEDASALTRPDALADTIVDLLAAENERSGETYSFSRRVWLTGD